MKQAEIEALFQQFEAAALVVTNGDDGRSLDCWSARQLQVLLGYAEWRNFQKVINKAKLATQEAGEALEDHFVETNKKVALGSEADRLIKDYALTRYACYLIAQNGDPAKPAIAFAQSYFAVQTRKQELIAQNLLERNRLIARDKLTESEKRLSSVLYQRGVDGKGFGMVRSKGDQALFGGMSTLDMKQRYGVAPKRALADFLPTLLIKAKDFATEMTSHNVVDKDLRGQGQIGQEHIDNNSAVRSMLTERGIVPEQLPPGEDVQTVRKRLAEQARQAAKGTSGRLNPSKGTTD